MKVGATTSALLSHSLESEGRARGYEKLRLPGGWSASLLHKSLEELGRTGEGRARAEIDDARFSRGKKTKSVCRDPDPSDLGLAAR